MNNMYMSENKAEQPFEAKWVLSILLVLLVVTVPAIMMSPEYRKERRDTQTKEQKIECFDNAMKAGMAHGYALRFCEIE